MKKSHDKFCSLPWVDLNLGPTGHYGLCCEADHSAHTGKDRVPASQPIEIHWNSGFMKSIRRQFISGEIPDICHSCKRDESVGIRSRRQRANLRYIGEASPDIDHPLVRSLLDQTSADGHSNAQLKGVDISIGNSCQLRCIHCSPSYSRSVAKDYQKLGLDYNDKNRMPISIIDRITHQEPIIYNVLDQLKKSIDSIEYIKFVGGEPSITRSLLEFLTWCVDAGHSRHLTILLYTNAVTVNDKFVALLRNFQRVLLGISLDGIGPVDEWIRYPTNWERKSNNIKKLTQAFPDSFIATTLFSLNIHDLSTMIEWCRSNGYRHSVNTLNWPDEFSIRHLPIDAKKDLANTLDDFAQTLPLDHDDDRVLTDSQYRSFIKKTIDFMLMNDADPIQWAKCLDTIKSYNAIRPRNLQEVNPFFKEFLSSDEGL